MAIDPGVRRIVVGVDGSAESVAALRWACREASLRAAEVHAVLALASTCHQVASYAVPTPLVLGRTAHGPDPYRGAGPVIRVCLRAAPCPVVIIGPAATASHDDHVPESWQRTQPYLTAAR